LAPRSDCRGQLVERGGAAELTVDRVSAEFVVSSSEVLDERVTADDHAGRPVGLQPAHRSEPRFQSAVVALDPVVRVLLGVVNRVGQEVRDHVCQGRGTVGDDLVGLTVREHCRREERACCDDVATS
jgi:hypothetical protein